MEDKEIKQIKTAPKKSSVSYVALVGFNTSDDKRFEEGDAVSGLKPSDEATLLRLSAIAEEK